MDFLGTDTYTFKKLLPRCNSAIESIVKKYDQILVPEEGGWLTYLDYPKKYGKQLTFVKCNLSEIDLEDLAEKLPGKDVFIYHSMGGYFKKNKVKEIYNLCKKNNVLCVMDSCGSLGTNLIDHSQADILICSFGKWKILWAGEGGIIYSKKNFNLDLPDFKGDLSKLNLMFNTYKERLKKLDFLRDQVKSFFPGNVCDGGYVVFLPSSIYSENEISSFCEKNSLTYEKTPRYIRSMQPGFSIEIKRNL